MEVIQVVVTKRVNPLGKRSNQTMAAGEVLKKPEKFSFCACKAYIVVYISMICHILAICIEEWWGPFCKGRKVFF
jgi:hypothetical protein